MDASAASLLSLSIAAASASPIPLASTDTPLLEHSPATLTNNIPPPIQPSSSIGTTPATHKSHRRLSSTGKARRRLSDAREAASRPSPAVALHASPPALSLASLSLSSSPPSTTHHHPSASLTGAAVAASAAAASPLNDGSNVPRATAITTTNPDASPNAKPIPIGTGKKRGVEHKCESCSKIYRHPSCLIKHRWEHTPHWREASKFVLSKHQQVQLLEAAAILSHLSPQSSSLPEDRSLWPSFLSGGSLPPPDPSTLMLSSSTSDTTQTHKRSVSASVSTAITGVGAGVGAAITPANVNGSSTAAAAVVVSSSVPATVTAGFNRASSTGPRMHDYSIPIGISNNGNGSNNPGGATQVRGLFGIPNGHTPTPPTPMSVPITTTLSSHSWSSVSIISEMGGGGGGGGGGSSNRIGWSLPRSSIRSISGSSHSRSKSDLSDEEENDDMVEEEEEEEEEENDESIDGSVSSSSFGRLYYGSSSSNGRRYGNGYSHHRTQAPPPPTSWKREEEDLTTTFGNGMSWSLKEEDEGGVTAAVVAENGSRKVGGGGGVPASGVRDEKEWDGMEMEMDMD